MNWSSSCWWWWWCCLVISTTGEHWVWSRCGTEEPFVLRSLFLQNIICGAVPCGFQIWILGIFRTTFGLYRTVRLLMRCGILVLRVHPGRCGAMRCSTVLSRVSRKRTVLFKDRQNHAEPHRAIGKKIWLHRENKKTFISLACVTPGRPTTR